MQPVAVHILSKTSADLAMDLKDRNAIASDCAPALDVHWLAANVRRRPYDQLGLSLESVVFISALGLGLGGVFRPVWEGVGKKAGEDLWSGVKTLLKGIWLRQAHRSYQLQSKAFVVLELQEEYVEIRFTPPALNEHTTVDDLEKSIQAQIDSLLLASDHLRTEVTKFKLGSNSPRTADKPTAVANHIIRRTKDGAWRIDPYDTGYAAWYLTD